MRYLFYLIWILLLYFGIYLRKREVVVVPRWIEISSAALFLIFFWLYVMLWM
jgi:hypothetical protein